MILVWRIGYLHQFGAKSESENAGLELLRKLGHGSTLTNGRWHLKSVLQVVYAGSSRALCQLEKRVHSNGANPKNQALMKLELPSKTKIMDAEQLGLVNEWRSNEALTQKLGMSWIESGESLGLWVPSYIEPAEKNMLINPAHEDYLKIKLHIERYPFRFDPRLF